MVLSSLQSTAQHRAEYKILPLPLLHLLQILSGSIPSCVSKDIYSNIMSYLKEKNIKTFTLYKSNNELNKISDEIMQENREFIDFISITRTGMKYIVNIEERIIKDKEEEKERCHIIAKKEGVITKIDAKKGITLVEEGSLVKKGDILISGEIILNEEIKDNTCAKGDIKANVWYKINISYPLTETIKTYTKREKVNLKMYNKYFKKRLYEKYDEYTMFKFRNLKLVRQKEYKEEVINSFYHSFTFMFYLNFNYDIRN